MAKNAVIKKASEIIRRHPGKIPVILGPTASGKTGLGVELAWRLDGEIVSADSRQVYRGMDVGTGKDLLNYELRITNCESKRKSKTVKIPYHLIDVASPKTKFDLAKYQKLAYEAIVDILRRGKLPIVVGGSGLYLQAIVDDYELSAVKPDRKLRIELEKKSVAELFTMLKKINKTFAGKLNNSDRNNKRRLIRYLEIARNQKANKACKARKVNGHEYLLIGLRPEKEELEKRIYERLIERLEKEDMVGEVERLHGEGVSWQRLEDFGLEYKFIAWHLEKKIDYETMVEKLNIAIRQFAKRQLVWFRRWEKQGREIEWI